MQSMDGARVNMLRKWRVLERCPHMVGPTQTRSKIHLHTLLVQIDIPTCCNMNTTHVCMCWVTGEFWSGAHTSSG